MQFDLLVGSAGAYNFIGFRDYVIRHSRTRLYALLNISSIGLTAMTWELANLNYCDVDLCCKLTHCFTGHTMRIVDEHGKLLDDARRAWDAGIIMDIGHGAGSFSFETAEALMGAGYRPDVISSDIHQMSVHGPMFDLPTVMSKFLLLGMSLKEVIRATTLRPAQVMGLQSEVGTLKPGAYADVALFKVCNGDFTFYDVFMNARNGKQMLQNTPSVYHRHRLTTCSSHLPSSASTSSYP